MATTNRPRRSMLYVPGSTPRALDKARGLAADALIFDLEDAVAPEAKEQARAGGGRGGARRRLRAARDAGAGQRPVDALGRATTSLPRRARGADGILIPKVESAAAVRAVDELLATAGAPECMAIWCMMETPRGILRADEIARASPRLGGLVMGTSDLAKDLHAAPHPTRLPLLTALSLCLLAARAYGLAASTASTSTSTMPRASSGLPPGRWNWASTARP